MGKLQQQPLVVQEQLPLPARTLRPSRRRRPSGEEPPLPYAIDQTGRYWVMASCLVLVAWVLAFSNFLRPRPLGIQILGDWTMWAHPPGPVAVLSATLVGMIYALLPQGRLRQLGKLVATAAVVVPGLARVYLAVDSPTDVLVGAITGVTIPPVAFRALAPTRRSRWSTAVAAAPTWTSAGAAARRSTGHSRISSAATSSARRCTTTATADSSSTRASSCATTFWGPGCGQ